MKTFILYSFTLVLIITSCHNTENCSNENLLLAKEVSVSCVTDINNKNNPDWTRSFNKLEFFKTIFDLIPTGKINLYGGYAIEDTAKMKLNTSVGIEERMRKYVDTFDLDLLNEIRFLEKWKLDKKTFKFSKKITAWTPIKIWKENGKIKKQMVFFAYPKQEGKGKLIAKNIIYEHPWYQEYPNIYTGFDQLKFLQLIIEGIKSDELKIYDPIYLVDKSKREFTPKQLEEYLKIELNPFHLDIDSILFEEDWYFNENTFEITKDVKSIAFVGYDFEDPDKEPSKKILFFIFPK